MLEVSSCYHALLLLNSLVADGSPNHHSHEHGHGHDTMFAGINGSGDGEITFTIVILKHSPLPYAFADLLRPISAHSQHYTTTSCTYRATTHHHTLTEDVPSSGEKKQFLNKRAGHYNEFKVLQAMRAKLAAEEDEDEDEDDENDS